MKRDAVRTGESSVQTSKPGAAPVSVAPQAQLARLPINLTPAPDGQFDPGPAIDLAQLLAELSAAKDIDELRAKFSAALKAVALALQTDKSLSPAAGEQLAAAAGKRLWALSKGAAGNPVSGKARVTDAIGIESHYKPLRDMEVLLETIKSDPSYASPNLEKFLQLATTELSASARGVRDIDLDREAKSPKGTIRLLITGFDPFGYNPQSATPYPEGTRDIDAGNWNPSGAAALALDGKTYTLKTGEKVIVEAVVIPVRQEFFDERSIETLVTPLLTKADAIVTISRGGNFQLEQFLGGNRSGNLSNFPSGATVKDESAIDVAGGAAPLLSANADVASIAARANKRSLNQSKHSKISTKADVGTGVSFEMDQAAFDTFVAEVTSSPPFNKITKADLQRWYTPPGSSAAGVAQPGKLYLDPSALKHADQRRQLLELLESIKTGLRRPTPSTGAAPSQSAESELSFSGGTPIKMSVYKGPGGNYYSNEISYRVNHTINQSRLAQKPQSFHLHVPKSPQAARNAVVARIEQILMATAEELAAKRSSQPQSP